MTTFTPFSSLLGGLLIGLSASLMLWSGRAAGISGITGGLVAPRRGDWLWRAQFVGGLLMGGLLLRALHPQALGLPPGSPLSVAAAGALVGLGAGLGNGCTSGHGICGLARLSPRSFVAVAVFMFTGALAVALIRHLGGTP